MFPGGIDFDTFNTIVNTASTKTRLEHMQDLFKGKKVIVSRDRVDEIEGVPLKLHAIEKLFNKYPEWKGKVIHFQVHYYFKRNCFAHCLFI